MAMTTLDPRTALIVVDLQKALVSRATIDPIAEVVKRAATLAETFRRLHLPVVLVHVEGAPPGRTERPSNVSKMPPGGEELVPELNQQPTDLIVTKRNWGAFTNTGLEERLKDLRVTQVVIAGVATSIGVESTARHARELGFNVTLAVDAMTDLDAEAQNNSVTRIFPRLGETGTTEEIVRMLEGRSR